MNKPTLSTYEQLTFEEASRIMFYCLAFNRQLYTLMMEDLIASGQPAYKSVTPRWYESYRDMITENNKTK
ncbi:MAG: hypothetical protein JWP27_1459 [Flaviaesturariibacter sp.]|nr:hypothetical protein [Flaviaesturariibacter sp.]